MGYHIYVHRYETLLVGVILIVDNSKMERKTGPSRILASLKKVQIHISSYVCYAIYFKYQMYRYALASLVLVGLDITARIPHSAPL